MDQVNSEIINCIKTWLSNRSQNRSRDDINYYQAHVLIQPPGDLNRSYGLPDLILNRYEASVSGKSQPDSQGSIELNQLFGLMSKFSALLRKNRDQLESFECMRNVSSKKLAQFHVKESIDLVQSCLSLDLGLEFVSQACVNLISVDSDDTRISEITSQLITGILLNSKTLVVCKSSRYYTCLLLSYLVDLLLEAGFSSKTIQLFVQDQRTLNDVTISSLQSDLSYLRSSPGKGRAHRDTKASAVSICFNQTDTSVALRETIDTYLRDLKHPNLLLFVEESIYSQVDIQWNDIFDRLLQPIDIKVDQNCLDVRAASRHTGNCIHLVKFRSIPDLYKLIGKVKRISQIQVWSSNHILAQEFCLSPKELNQCGSFWLNHKPPSVFVRQFCDQTLSYVQDMNASLMNEIYSRVIGDCENQVDRLRRIQLGFYHKNSESKRVGIVLKLYLKLISKYRSMKNLNSPIHESVTRLKRFHSNFSNSIHEIQGQDESRIETILRPIGICLIVANGQATLKSKSLLIELVFKNLLLGNGVLLVASSNLLGSRFPLNLFKPQKVPFDIVLMNSIQAEEDPEESDMNEGEGELDSVNMTNRQSTPISQTSIATQDPAESPDSGVAQNDSMLRRQPRRPSSVYVIDLSQKINWSSTKIDSLILSLGCHKRRIWFPNGYRICNPSSSQACESTSQSDQSE